VLFWQPMFGAERVLAIVALKRHVREIPTVGAVLRLHGIIRTLELIKFRSSSTGHVRYGDWHALMPHRACFTVVLVGLQCGGRVIASWA